MSKYKKVSVVIPVFNEEKTIVKVVKAVMRASTKGLKKEIIIVNDGSTDRTKSELTRLKTRYRNLRVFHKKNGGKGSALRLGISKARGQIVVPQDADLELSPNDYEKLIEPILTKRASVVFGDRNWRKAQIPLHSKMANCIVTFLANFLYKAKIKDEACGYKVATRAIYQSLNLQSMGFDICPETLSKIRKLGYSICTVPVHFQPRRFSDGKKIKFEDGFKAVWSLIKFRFIV